MRSPSGRMRQVSVTLLPSGWTADLDGGRYVGSQGNAVGTCSAQPGEAIREELNNRVTTIVPWELRFSSDPALKADDVIMFTEGARTHYVKVAGTTQRMLRGATYRVSGHEYV